MKIKRFTAPDMRTALHLVREEQGEHAVILSSQRHALGVEVVAATDYDEALMQTALRCESAALQAARKAASEPVQDLSLPPPPAAKPSLFNQALAAVMPPPPPQAAPAAKQKTVARATFTASEPSSHAAPPETPASSSRRTPGSGDGAPATTAAAAPPQSPGVRRDDGDMSRPTLAAVPTPTVDPAVADMRRDLGLMRELIEREVGRFADERLRGHPVRAMVLDELLDYGCDEEMSRAIATAIPPDADPGRARGMLLALLAKSLLHTAKEPIFESGVIALVGPTGVGKTTTLAKLASRYAATGRARDVALVSADSYRLGAREQLAHYGRLLGMPVFEAAGGEDLARVLERLGDYPLVLVDTAGFGQRDNALATQFAWHNAPRPVRSLLVLPANAQPRDLDEVIRRFRGAAPEAAVLTKLDETGQLGAALSVVSRARLPLAYVTDGQRVPDDIHKAEPHRLVLRLGELRRAANKSLTPDSNEETRHVAA